MNITVSYNHFYDCGKTSLGGMKSETTDCWMTYHHNWFDHSDSRHPRIRTAFYHVYNNYFDGVSKYGVGVTTGGSSFVEANYFRNCKYPMLISKQGTDAEGDGTFSGELEVSLRLTTTRWTTHARSSTIRRDRLTANGMP